MKKAAVRELAAAMHRADPSACFAFELWDGETIAFGALPTSSIHFNDPRALRRMFSKGFHGFAESYVFGDLEIEGDFQLLLRLGLDVSFDEKSYSLRRKARFL